MERGAARSQNDEAPDRIAAQRLGSAGCRRLSGAADVPADGAEDGKEKQVEDTEQKQPQPEKQDVGRDLENGGPLNVLLRSGFGVGRAQSAAVPERTASM